MTTPAQQSYPAINVSEETDVIAFYNEFNTNFQKRKGKLWTYTYVNNAKEQID